MMDRKTQRKLCETLESYPPSAFEGGDYSPDGLPHLNRRAYLADIGNFRVYFHRETGDSYYVRYLMAIRDLGRGANIQVPERRGLIKRLFKRVDKKYREFENQLSEQEQQDMLNDLRGFL